MTAETYARGVERAAQVVAISAGAVWIQKVFDLQCPDAIRILDVPHAAQRLSHIAGAVRGEGNAAARTWQDEQITALKQHGPAGVLAAVEALATAHPEVATVSEDAAYLTKRRALMDYQPTRPRECRSRAAASSETMALIMMLRNALQVPAAPRLGGNLDEQNRLGASVCQRRSP